MAVRYDFNSIDGEQFSGTGVKDIPHIKITVDSMLNIDYVSLY
jgi:hypothetical protein